ncbi:hypothetical protein [Brasilonema bromeliae]|uniref:Uncharacterized protein n=1 Tax=Brasilonema bromeliae SPC951 TaxID=385972 RepID=A0ABX1PGD7_9CYAN|nr:hypothetical protein [Brasilonema bromeliae]NMG22636.1 hypothetical protein [Brasilonema bromeliae SPC951]
MTQSVADETPIPDTSWRRHTDPPSLWIAVTTISLTLHLLLFWLLRSYSYNLLSQRNSSNPIPVEFVEISSQPKAPSKAKPVLFKKPSTTQKSSVTSSPKLASQGNLTPKSTSSVEDSNAIALTNPTSAKTSQSQVKNTTQQSLKKQVIKQKQPQPNPQPIATSQPTRQPEPFIAKTPEPPLQPTPEDTPQAQQPQPTPDQTQPEPRLQPTPEAQQPQPTPEPTTLADNPDTQNQGNQQELGEQNQALNPENNTTDSTSTNSSPETGEQAKPANESTESPSTLPRQSDDQVILGKKTPSPDLGPLVTPEQSPLDEPKVGGLVAFWDIPENLAQPQDNSRRKELNIVLPDTAGDFQPVDFLVWLTIDEQGTLWLIKVDQEIPQPQRSQYQKYANEIFKGQKFVPATDKDPATGKQKSGLRYLSVRVKIERP